MMLTSKKFGESVGPLSGTPFLADFFDAFLPAFLAAFLAAFPLPFLALATMFTTSPFHQVIWDKVEMRSLPAVRGPSDTSATHQREGERCSRILGVLWDTQERLDSAGLIYRLKVFR